MNDKINNMHAMKEIASATNNMIRYLLHEDKEFNKLVEETKSNLNTLYDIPSIVEATILNELEIYNYIQQTYLNKSNKDSIFFQIQSIKKNANLFLDFFKTSHKIYEEFSSNILDKMSAITEIHDIITKMQAIAKEIKLFSINSVVVSSSAGSQGLGFKSISRFIIELSDAIQKSAIQLETYKDKILNAQEALKEQFSYLLNNIYTKKMNKFSESYNKNIRECQKKTFSFQYLMTETHNQCQHLLSKFESIKNISFTRQVNLLEYYDNVLNFIRDIPLYTPSTLSNIYIVIERFETMYTILNEQKMHHKILEVDINNLFDEILDHEKNVHLFKNFHQDQLFISKFLTQNHEGWNPLIPSIFKSMNNILNEMEDIIDEETQIKQYISNIFHEIDKIYYEGVSFFNNFEKFFVTMNNINILAQIELNKNNFGQAENSGMKVKFINMLNQIKEFNEDIKNKIQKMLGILLIEASKFNEMQNTQASVLKEYKSSIHLELSKVNFLNKDLNQLIHTLEKEIYNAFSIEQRLKNIISNYSHIENRLPEGIFLVFDLLSKETKFFSSLKEKYDLNFDKNSQLNKYLNSYRNMQTKIT